jgi:hypothetical protein
MSLRDALFKCIKGVSGYNQLHAQEKSGSNDLLISWHASGGRNLFIEGRQGIDAPVASLAGSVGKVLSNAAQLHAERRSGSNDQVAAWHSTAWSGLFPCNRICSHGAIDTIVPIKSWWAFFLKYLAGRKGK